MRNSELSKNNSKLRIAVKPLGRIGLITGVLGLAGALVVIGQAPPALPGTSMDRVGFPEGYRDTYTLLYVFDNYQNRQIRAVYGNDTAASVTPAQPYNFPYGSILLFEDYPAKLDDSGEPIVDENGRYVRGDLRTIFVMRKELGFGEEYKQIRNGEWEYISYRPDKTFATPPSGTGSCALCHLTGSGLALTPDSKPVGAKNDFVFRSNLYFSRGSGAVPDAVLQSYTFVPRSIHVKSGSTVTIYNDDELLHHIVADDGSFDSGIMTQGSSLTVKVGDPGEIPVHCTIHSRMKGRIIVDAPE